uniref:Transmembrane protein n=1 Tax=Mesocestoides corti TaxID=53468 RepID=A0A5K3FV65_MESCO
MSKLGGFRGFYLVGFVLLLYVSATVVSTKKSSNFLAEQMLDAADSDSFSVFTNPLARCYDVLEEMRMACNQNCHRNAPDQSSCLQDCWGGWKYGRLTCRLSTKQRAKPLTIQWNYLPCF